MVNIVNSTSKFGVKLDGRNTRVKYPHLKNRFRVEFVGLSAPIGGANITMDAKECSLPKPTYEKKSIDTYNGVVHYSGRKTWGDVSMTIYNSIDNMVYREILRQSELQFDSDEKVSATVASNYKFITNIYHLGGAHETLSRWQLEGCWFQALDFGSMSYDSTDAMTINVTMSIDNALFFDENDILVTTDGAISTLLNNALAVK